MGTLPPLRRARRTGQNGRVHRFLLSILAALTACAPRGAAVSHPTDRPNTDRPNIVFILTDDQAPWAIGRAAGSPRDLRTPNMDRLAREGAFLPNAFVVTPVCSPSRAALLTGRYGSEVGITEWINPRSEPEVGLDPALVTWPALLRRAGYATALVGKWHLGTRAASHPRHFGYQEFRGFLGGGTRPRDPVLEVDGQSGVVAGFEPEIFAGYAVDFIRRHREGPFLLSLHFRAPHAPWLPLPEVDWAPYRGLDPELPDSAYPGLDVPRVKTMMREYLASVASVDRAVGAVLGALDSLGIAGRTIVVFTSDNGYSVGHGGIWHKGNGHWIVTDPPAATPKVPVGQRPNMFDRSLRVPTAVRWPGTISPGTVVQGTVSNLDWYPTLLAAAGVRSPESTLVRGRDAGPLLAGRSPAGWSDDLYAEYSTRHQSRTHMRAMRAGGWKLVRDLLDPARDELYALTRDPEERTNLIASEASAARAALATLDAALRERMRMLGDTLATGRAR